MGTGRYEAAGVGSQADALAAVVRHLGPTLTLPENADVLTRFGHYASVLKVADDLAIAISTDGVGSKTIIASELGRYDTIGIDCMAMNVNDILCVGARPIAMVDYLGVNTLDPIMAEEILRGLGAAAATAGVAIPGGELAQLPEVIGSKGGVPGDPAAFDLVGTCIGTVHPAQLILGERVAEGDALIGIASSGIHSNGLTLARRVLLQDAGYHLNDFIGRLGGTLGDELLRPTEIYVRGITSLWSAGVTTTGLVHVTSDGLTNLCRLDAPAGFLLDDLPPPQGIFSLIQEAGAVPSEEMYRVFNMGTGFIVVCPPSHAARAIEVLRGVGYRAQKVGTVTAEEGVVRLIAQGLVGTLAGGTSTFKRP